ncbi:uncharacterized protein N7483_011082 [Penicillium malachiteum]|uniref:uncharacterized protein n=1 Tax=Penicillium malachiteum TaxID=1324776 RepID=UPI0025481CA6|nr:uncharacterized protein N7483_011082 [Penicillium malachiteum]KAJ5713901.1 hypothetical protein N7483_011082 [Penicillium malachiteum]
MSTQRYLTDPESETSSSSNNKSDYLGLPYDVFRLILKILICFDEIRIEQFWACSKIDDKEDETKRSSDKFWLRKHNPRKNLLAIMAVNRAIYEAARLAFYSLNRFKFMAFDLLPVFLIGIRPKNMQHLQVVWNRVDFGKWENVAQDHNLNRYLLSKPNNEIELNLSLLREDFPTPFPLDYPEAESSRVVRLEDASGSSILNRWRYKLSISAWKVYDDGTNPFKRYEQEVSWRGCARFELCIQKDESLADASDEPGPSDK